MHDVKRTEVIVCAALLSMAGELECAPLVPSGTHPTFPFAFSPRLLHPRHHG